MTRRGVRAIGLRTGVVDFSVSPLFGHFHTPLPRMDSHSGLPGRDARRALSGHWSYLVIRACTWHRTVKARSMEIRKGRCIVSRPHARVVFVAKRSGKIFNIARLK
jgi:hypothetical protein